ncbi:MAG: hypothetical protein WBE58_23890 [Verrucomicrobiales bacterium]
MTLPATPPASTSLTGSVDGRESQFTVECEDRITRGATSSFAESLGADFRKLMGLENWNHHIRIKMQGSLSDVLAGPETARQIILGPDGKFVLYLHVRLSERFRKETLTRELYRLLILDQMLHGRESDPGLDGRRLTEPSWLLEGAQELGRFRSQGRPSAVFGGLIKSRQFLTTDKVLAGVPDDCDSITRAVWVASSTALVAALLAQPEAASGFRDFLRECPDVPASSGGTADAALLRRHFPALRGSQDSLDKWWALELATMGERHLMEFISVPETEAALDEALKIRLEPPRDEEGKSKEGALSWLKKWVPGNKKQEQFLEKGFDGQLRDFEAYAGLPGDDDAVKACQSRLTNLRHSCFPVYRILIDRYLNAATNLLEGKWQGVADDLAAADLERVQLRDILRQVEDRMNFEEATRAPVDEEFQDYDKAVQRLNNLPKIQRKDRISTYLDAVEREMK